MRLNKEVCERCVVEHEMSRHGVEQREAREEFEFDWRRGLLRCKLYPPDLSPLVVGSPPGGTPFGCPFVTEHVVSNEAE